MTVALRMRWVDLAFLHWPVAVEAVRPLVPEALELESFGGTAWVGVTPFRMTRVRPRFLPPVPTARDFLELNVRTYVRHRDRIGVYFFSLDAESALAVAAARLAVNLPYMRARMSQRWVGEDVEYASVRTHTGAPPAEFRASYAPSGDPTISVPGTLEYWSTERYSLFTVRGGTVLRLDIEHAPWPLRPATVRIERNTMAAAAGIPLPSVAPRVHYCESLDVVAHLPRAVGMAR